MPPIDPTRDRITVAILALGGEGGGVLADWIIALAEANGYVAQGTSVPGVAQRTGATIYYVEMIRRQAAGANRPEPVLALMPVPGDVDIVIASELMEAGRAILRGFVSDDRTTLIGSTHRVHAISEKSAPGDGTAAGQRILDVCERRARRFIGFDMAAAASQAGSVISSIMFGALAGSGALPFAEESFAATIRAGGKAVEPNLRGLALGAARAREGEPEALPAPPPAGPTTEAGRALTARIAAELPPHVRPIAVEGARRLTDYQDAGYAALYLDRLGRILALDDGRDDWRLTAETARHLALWMAFEDTIRVADLKVRGSRMRGIEGEVRLAPGQLLSITEYMHPRYRELCETLPASLGARLWASRRARRLIEPRLAKGRHVRTTGLRWFLMLRLLAGLRRFRPRLLRYAEEQARIVAWLDDVAAAATDPSAAAEIARCPELIKGYSDTFERSLAKFATVMKAARDLPGRPEAAARIAALREAALADDDGAALACAVKAQAN